MQRRDGRQNNQLRPTSITTGFLAFAEGSTLIELGKTRVVCAVSIEESVPPFLKGRGKGWVTAEYSMLPRSTLTRKVRESTVGRVGGRTHEIQRLIGRSLRAIVDLGGLGERTFVVDCDVLQADGGTRTAAITGAYVALVLALRNLQKAGRLSGWPLKGAVAAISTGIVNGHPMLDLTYEEDSQAEVDLNVAMTGQGELVEIQGTAEGKPFNRRMVDRLLDLAHKGIEELLVIQEKSLSP